MHSSEFARDLRARFPYQFDGKTASLYLGEGWAPVFAKLCEDVDALLGRDKRGFRWIQLKEKWGSARFYFEIFGRQTDFRMDIANGRGDVVSKVMEIDKDKNSARQRKLLSALRKLIMNAEMTTRETCAVCGKPGELDRSDSYVIVLCAEHQKLRADADGDLPDCWLSFEEDKGSAGGSP